MTAQTNKFAVSAEQKARGLKDRDTLQRFLFKDKPVQGFWVNANNTLSDIFELQPDLPRSVRKLLAEFVIIANILHAQLKQEGSVFLAIRSPNAAVENISAFVSNHGITANARIADNVEFAEDAKLEEILNPEANIFLMIKDTKGHSYQSIIKMNLNSLAEAAADYFQQSVQTPVYIKIASEIIGNTANATGLYLQYIPDDSGTVEDFEDITVLAASAQDSELLELSANDMLYRLFNQEEVSLGKDRELQFKCTCSYERNLEVACSLGRDDIESLIAEHHGEAIESVCTTCNKVYQLQPADLRSELDKLYGKVEG